MAKVSLEDLRKGAPAARPERSYALCIRRDLLAEVDQLAREIAALKVSDAISEDSQPPRRKGQGENPALAEKRVRMTELDAAIDDATGDLRLRAIPDGEWRRFVNEHQARDGDERDEQVTYGICNADDLIDSLAQWAALWNDDALSDRDWDNLLAPNAAGGDLKAIANLVVQMQEAADDPKWLLRALRAGQTNNVAEHSPEQ